MNYKKIYKDTYEKIYEDQHEDIEATIFYIQRHGAHLNDTNKPFMDARNKLTTDEKREIIFDLITPF